MNNKSTSITREEIREMVRASLLREGFFDLKDSPILQGLGVVDGEEPQQSLPGANDAWANLELAISGIPTKLASKYGPKRSDDEETGDDLDYLTVFRPKIARHLDFDNDNLTGDKDDIRISFEKLAQLDIEFVESESLLSNQVAIDFCKSVKKVANFSEISNIFLDSRINRYNQVRETFRTYLSNQQEINSSFFANVLNSVAEIVIQKNFKSIIAKAISENPDSFIYTSDEEFDPSAAILSFPFQIALLTGEQSLGGAYFKVNCELDFNNIFQQLNDKAVLFGPKLDINYAWKIKVERSLEVIQDIAVIPVRVHNLNRPELFKFIIGVNKLANDIVTAQDPPSLDDIQKIKSPENASTWDRIIYYSKVGQLGIISSRGYNSQPTYLTDTERKVQITRELLSAVKHLKSEQGNLFTALRAREDYAANNAAKRMISVIGDLPDLDYLEPGEFLLGDYLKKLKIFVGAYPHSDMRIHRDYYESAGQSVEEFREYVMNNNQQIVQSIRRQIKILEGELNETVSKIIFERVKRRLKLLIR